MDLEAYDKRDWISGLIAQARSAAGLIGTPGLIAERIERYEALGRRVLCMLTFPSYD